MLVGVQTKVISTNMYTNVGGSLCHHRPRMRALLVACGFWFMSMFPLTILDDLADINKQPRQLYEQTSN
jgi:hypothetical protein